MRLTACLSEAKRIRLRAFIRDAESLSLAQDAADQRMLVRCAVGKGLLVIKRSTLGISKNFGTDAFSVRNATVDVITRFCTVGRGMPLRGGAPGRSKGVFDAELYNHMVNITEYCVTDSASDEMAAGRLLKEVMPNLRYHARDNTHATKRTILEIV